MYCHCDTNNRAPRWTFTNPCKPEVRPGARKESASTTWQAASAMNARDTTKVYIWRLYNWCGLTLYRKCHSHNTPGKRHNTAWVEPLPGKRNKCDKNVKYKRTDVLSLWHKYFNVVCIVMCHSWQDSERVVNARSLWPSGLCVQLESQRIAGSIPDWDKYFHFESLFVSLLYSSAEP